MIDKIKDASKLAVIPAAILYFMGFVCTAAYLARFGITAFDIVNARYMIAGVFPLICMFVSMTISVHMWRTIFSEPKFFSRNLDSRVQLYFQIILFPLVASSAISYLFNLGNKIRRPDSNQLKFTGLFGDADPLKPIIDSIINGMPATYAYALKYSIYISICVLVAFYSIYALIFLIDAILKAVRPTQHKKNTERSDNEKVSFNNANETQVNNPASRLKNLQYAIDIIWISTIAALFMFSSARLQSAVFDYNSFGSKSGLTNGLVFSWVFGSTISIYFFLSMCGNPSRIDLGVTFARPLGLSQSIYIVFTPLLVSIFLFGTTLFPRIPFAIGGGEPRAVKISVKSDVNLAGRDFYLIGESSQFLFLVDNTKESQRAIQLSKDVVQYMQMRDIPDQRDK